jgi:exodeoxyribonuclease VII large subunit
VPPARASLAPAAAPAPAAASAAAEPAAPALAAAPQPTRLAAAGGTSPRHQPRALSVREVVGRIQAALHGEFPSRFWVEGEISNWKVSRGNAFFCLKDDEAQVEALLWSSTLRALRFTPADGMQVLALVRSVDFYAPGGRLRVVVDRVEPRGAGALARALEELRRRLQAQGLFDEARKRPLPLLPATVGIATATTGAVIHDMMRVLQQRFPDRRIVIRPCRVQGDGAAADVADAIDDLNRIGGVDVIVVARGGGSVEDLWAFNEEAVVRAIARSRVPVVSAVGHESDTTLADFAADLRAPTPTAAAQRVMPERDALAAGLDRLGRGLREALARRVEISRSRLETREAKLGDPRRRLDELRLRADRLLQRGARSLEGRVPALRTRLAQLAARLAQRAPATDPRRAEVVRLERRLAAAAARPVQRGRHDLAEAAARLEALSPLAVLSRGFALVRRQDGSIVRDAAALAPGETIDLHFARGAARAGVLEVAAAEDADAGGRAERDRGARS